MSSSVPVSHNNHNHSHCIDDALKSARDICRERGVKLTEQREQVLRLVWQSHKPLGAYTLIEMLSELTGKSIAPPTVYRALEFLMDLGLIHRINSLNAFLGCSHPQVHSQIATGNTNASNYFLICSRCHVTEEILDVEVSERIAQIAIQKHFRPQQQWLEVTGLCVACQAT